MANSQMKLAIVTWCFPARSETSVREHVMGLRRRGHDVAIFSTGPNEGITTDELVESDNAGVNRIVLPMFGRGRVRNGLRCGAYCLRHPHMVRHLFASSPWNRGELFLARKWGGRIARLAPDVLHIHYGATAGPLSRIKPRFLSDAVLTWHGYDATLLPRARCGRHGRGLR